MLPLVAIDWPAAGVLVAAFVAAMGILATILRVSPERKTAGAQAATSLSEAAQNLIGPLNEEVGSLRAAVIDLQRRLRHAEDTATAIFSLSSDALLLVNVISGVIENCNQGAHQLFGWPAGELYGRLLADLIPERLRERHGTHLLRYMRAPGTRPMGLGRHLAALRRDGSEIAVEIGLSPIGEQPGTILALIKPVA